MPAAHLLLADLEDIINTVIPFIVMVMWAASQLLGNKPKAKAKPPARPQPQAPAKVAGQAAPGNKPPSLEETLRREVEEFMRRAQGREPAKKNPPARPAAGPGRPTPQRQSRPPQRTVAEPPERTRRLTDAPGGLTAAAAESNRPAPLGSGVAQHVAQHLTGAQTIAAHTRSLGADVALADDRMREHLQDKFVHQVGSLEHRAQEQRPAEQRTVVRTPIADAIFKSLQSPDGVKQIIVASEILRRPEERWSRTGDA